MTNQQEIYGYCCLFEQTLIGLIGLTSLLQISLTEKILLALTDILRQTFQAETWLLEWALLTMGLLARIHRCD